MSPATPKRSAARSLAARLVVTPSRIITSHPAQIPTAATPQIAPLTKRSVSGRAGSGWSGPVLASCIGPPQVRAYPIVKYFRYSETAMGTLLDIAALGRRIRALRRQRDFSLEGLAERSGVSASMLSTVERGQKVPSILVLSQIATALDTSIA